MSTIRRRKSLRERADLLAYSEETGPAVLVVVKAREDAEANWVPVLLEYLEASEFPFGMYVDLKKILIFRWDNPRPDAPVLTLPTAEVLTGYEPEFATMRILHGYLGALIGRWLRDFSYHWKFEDPPFSREMEEIGLAGLLVRVMTRVGRRS